MVNKVASRTSLDTQQFNGYTSWSWTSALKMEAERCSETWVSNHQITRWQRRKPQLLSDSFLSLSLSLTLNTSVFLCKSSYHRCFILRFATGRDSRNLSTDAPEQFHCRYICIHLPTRRSDNCEPKRQLRYSSHGNLIPEVCRLDATKWSSKTNCPGYKQNVWSASK